MHRIVRYVGRGSEARRAYQKRRTIARTCVLLVLGVLGSACYTYQPIVGPATPGTRVAVELTDRGRAALVDSLGGFVQKVEGTVQTATDSLLVLRVASVEFLNGRTSRWTNEPVPILRDYIGRVDERRFSRGRTVLVSGGLVGALVAFITSQDLIGGGNSSRPTEPPPQGT